MPPSSKIIERISTGVLVLSRDFNFVYANPAAASLLGLAMDYLETLSPAISNLSPAFARLLESLSQGHFKKKQELEIVANGQYLSVRISRTEEGDYILELNPLQQQDISKSTHELKRPIQNIKALIEALMMGAKNETELLDKYLSKIAIESERLAHLVGDMLKLNYLLRAVIEPRRQEFLVQPMVDKILSAAAPKAAAQQVQLKSTINPKAVLVGDPELIEHALDNLIDNAIKYNRPKGLVKIEQKDLHSLQVQDTGLGIAKEELESLGEEFYRAKGSESIAGTGLGLTLVKRIVELHGGTLKIESTLGEGSIFKICL